MGQKDSRNDLVAKLHELEAIPVLTLAQYKTDYTHRIFGYMVDNGNGMLGCWERKITDGKLRRWKKQNLGYKEFKALVCFVRDPAKTEAITAAIAEDPAETKAKADAQKTKIKVAKITKVVKATKVAKVAKAIKKEAVRDKVERPEKIAKVRGYTNFCEQFSNKTTKKDTATKNAARSILSKINIGASQEDINTEIAETIGKI